MFIEQGLALTCDIFFFFALKQILEYGVVGSKDVQNSEGCSISVEFFLPTSSVFPFALWTTSVTLHSCQQIIPEKIVSSFKNIVSIDRKKGTILFLIVVKVTSYKAHYSTIWKCYSGVALTIIQLWNFSPSYTETLSPLNTNSPSHQHTTSVPGSTNVLSD